MPPPWAPPQTNLRGDNGSSDFLPPNLSHFADPVNNFSSSKKREDNAIKAVQAALSKVPSSGRLRFELVESPFLTRCIASIKSDRSFGNIRKTCNTFMSHFRGNDITMQRIYWQRMTPSIPESRWWVDRRWTMCTLGESRTFFWALLSKSGDPNLQIVL